MQVVPKGALVSKFDESLNMVTWRSLLYPGFLAYSLVGGPMQVCTSPLTSALTPPAPPTLDARASLRPSAAAAFFASPLTLLPLLPDAGLLLLRHRREESRHRLHAALSCRALL